MKLLKARPDALAIGPMKAGTTWLHDYLAARGDVCLPKGVKETLYFDRRTAKGDDWYFAHFAHFNPARHKRTMEVGSSYFHCAAAPERIRRSLGAVPLLVTVRDPVRRSWSHYLHLVRYGYTAEPLRDAVRRYPEIVEASQYLDVLERWWRVFGEDAVHIARFEALASDPDAYARHVCATLRLGLGDHGMPNSERANAAAVSAHPRLAYLATRAGDFLRSRRLYFLVNAAKQAGLKPLLYGRTGRRRPAALSDADREWLTHLLRPQVEALAAHTGGDFSTWFGP